MAHKIFRAQSPEPRAQSPEPRAQSPEPRAISELSRPSRTVALYASRRTVGWLLPVLATAIVLAPPFAPTAQAQTSYRIDTFAGLTGVGDSRPAIVAPLRFPTNIAVDGAGDLYIADQQNHRIRKVDSGGTITTIAGTGETGFGGDGGPAIEAKLSSPTGVAVDGAGNLYIVCWFNHRIRKVDSPGTIITIAGTEYGFSGDGGPATQAQLNSPYDVAVDDAGNLYIADRENQRIRKVDSTGTITTIAGTGEDDFGGDGGPAIEAKISADGVAVDGAGNLYIADASNHRIRKVDSTGTITTIAGTGARGFSGDGGPATEAELNFPFGVAVDGAGNLYIADTQNQRIRKVDSLGVITTIAGTGEGEFGGDGEPAAQAQLQYPSGLAVDAAGYLYIADSRNDRIRLLTLPPPPPRRPPGGGGGGGGGGTPRTSAPSAVRNLMVAGGNGEVVLTWDAPSSDGGEEITDYEYRINRSGPWISTGSTETTHTVTGLVNGTAYVFEVRAVNRRGRGRVSNRTEATPEVFTLDFAHFANGEGLTSDLVFVNVGTHPIRPALAFYDQEGQPMAPESVVEITGDLEVTEDGALSIQTAIEPLGELTISTHGQGELVSGSVRVTSGGPIGGVLRFDLPDIGVAGVGASPPVRDAVFPVRRQEGGINTGVAIHNLGEEPIRVTCELMQGGTVLDDVSIPLAANGQSSWFIDEVFTGADTSDFAGSVRCTAPGEGMFTGVAVELDAVNQIFTTLPVVPVPERMSQE